jgi:putative tricarboxylic transport membrane protein
LSVIISLFLMGFSLLILFPSLGMGIGTPGNPGPGFMPFLSSIVLFGLCLLVLIAEVNVLARNEKDGWSFVWGKFKKPVLLVISLISYAVLLKPLGYFIVTFSLILVQFLMYESKKWLVTVITALLFTVLSFLIFFAVLGVPLPLGPFKMMR